MAEDITRRVVLGSGAAVVATGALGLAPAVGGETGTIPEEAIRELQQKYARSILTALIGQHGHNDIGAEARADKLAEGYGGWQKLTGDLPLGEAGPQGNVYDYIETGLVKPMPDGPGFTKAQASLLVNDLIADLKNIYTLNLLERMEFQVDLNLQAHYASLQIDRDGHTVGDEKGAFLAKVAEAQYLALKGKTAAGDPDEVAAAGRREMAADIISFMKPDCTLDTNKKNKKYQATHARFEVVVGPVQTNTDVAFNVIDESKEGILRDPKFFYGSGAKTPYALYPESDLGCKPNILSASAAKDMPHAGVVRAKQEIAHALAQNGVNVRLR